MKKSTSASHEKQNYLYTQYAYDDGVWKKYLEQYHQSKCLHP